MDKPPVYSRFAPVRLVAADSAPREEQVERALGVLRKGRSANMLRTRGIHVEQDSFPGKVAFLFTGQGSQYIDMGLDLAEVYPIVRETFEEAEVILRDELPRPLTSYIRRDPRIPKEEQFEALRATEISQPATLTLDVALLRLLASYGVYPDMVAGHSLGEYAAAVAAGMLSFKDALIAVSARGREMASVKIDDPGKMAGVSTNEDKVADILKDIDGYVVAANKNCPTQTVIAGESTAVLQAMERFKEAGINTIPLPVSHAFHSRIVAPASEPFKRVLKRLDVRPPLRPFSTNVDASLYSTDPAHRDAIIDNLALQIASPVEWIKQIEAMYASGARIFVECGPKRALTGFVATILRRHEHRAIFTNHPKRGGVESFREALAALVALKQPVRAAPGSPELFADLPDGAASPVHRAPAPSMQPILDVLSAHLPGFNPADASDPEAIATILSQALANGVGQPAAGPIAGLPTALFEALSAGAVRSGLASADAQAFARQIAPSVASMVAAMRDAIQPHVTPQIAPQVATTAPAAPPVAVTGGGLMPLTEVVCSGASVGLPGGREVFAEDNFESIFNGDVRITRISETAQDRILDKNIVRLQKDAQTGQGEFVPVTKRDEVLHLAGQKSHFDPVEDYGLDARRVRALDICSQLAFAAGIEALRDAGVPLVQTYRETSKGRRLPGRVMLPESMRDTTGVIFASAFPGLSRFADLIRNNGDGGEARFERAFLFQVLSMGHSQLAELIGARGPNTQVNAACASTTQAVGIASDWIRAGRADRVVIVGADDVTNDALLEWVGAGFLVTGAATTSKKVEEAALPFDRRRHGMILGMGAVGMVIEKARDVQARGMVPIARLLSSRFNNSAYHGTRLDPHHIADEVSALVNEAARNANTTPEKMAKQTVFMSHETYTPARGGSAAAEISSLRHAFGASAGEVVITNTKGFTGHAMGASIEDAVVLKALQHTRVPPIPHLKEPDPDLGDLRMSPGGSFPVRYGLRLAAGFGSQIALLAWEKVADGDARTPQPAVYRKWLSDISGIQHPTTVIENRTLKVVEGEPVESPVEQPATAPAAAPQPAASAAAIPSGAVLDEIMKVISEKTGYGVDELEADYELEADLGVDTVKQAEIFGVIRDRYQLPQEDDFRLADYPTIEKLAGWVSERVGDTPAPVSASVTTESVTTESVTTESAPDAPAASAADVLGVVLSVISEKTGYDVEELEVDYELEADLGVDTVKQAEIFGVIRDRYELPQEDDFRLADYPTIEKLAGWVSERVGGSAPAVAPAPAPTPVPTKEPVPAAVSAPVSAVEPVPVPVSVPPSAAPASVLPILTRIISEKTGYGVDELEADYELEADLGVDTVKQAEIFGEVRDELGLARDDDFRLADYPTIAGLASYLQEQVSDGSTGPVLVPMNEDDAPTPEVSVKPSAANADLFEVPEPQSLPAASLSAPAPLPVVDEDTADGELPESFRIRRPVLVSRPAWFEGSLAGRAVEVLGDSALSVSIRAALEKRGAVFSDTPELVVDADTDVLAAFERARALDGARPVGWLCATRLGADPSMVPAEIGARAGARAGFTKALGREWERCSARVVDVASYVDDAVAAEIFCNELANLQGATEVFRDEHQRMVMALQTEPRPQGVGALKGEPVIVLTGGTRGITARVALELARRGRCRLALFARTAPGEAPLDEAATRKHIREELKAEGERGTPAQIETRMRPLRRAEEARQNIEQLRAAGAEVRFWSVNLADPAAVKRTMDSVRGFWGRIDGVIHGAGVEESRLIGDKDLSAFARVFDGKALGGLALIGALEDDAWFVSMGSIAGRFGNQGQVDYAAANEAMARVCLGRPRSLHVDWTAWGDVGMAVRGGMERLLTERGMELLPAAAGASLLVDMVLAGMWGEMVVAGQLGDLSIAADHPMLDHFRYDGDGVSAGRELSLSRDPWILDHAIDGTPVLPGVMGLEMMAAAAQLCALGMSPTSVREARFTAPVKLYGDAPTMLHIEAAPFDAETVQVRLSSSRVSRAGKTIRAEHFEAIIELSDIEPPSPLPPAILAELSLDRAGIYQRFFHGPRFQVLAEVVGVAQDGLEAEVRVDHAGLPGGLLTGPLLLEAAFQAAGMHRMIVDGEMALPSGFTSVALVRTPEEGAELWATVRRRGDRYDVDIDNNDGAVLMLRGFEMTKLDDLPPEDRIDAPEDGWPVAVVAQARFEAPPRVMSEDEEAKLTARGTPRRQRDRIAGRIAAKLAVSALTGAAPLTFTIDNLPSGQPAPTGVAAQLSLAHRDGTGWAVATPRGAPGIDVELIEARPASFAETWYTPEERALCQGDAMRESLIWACKEATLKALGTGLRLPTRSVEVIGIVGRRAQVRLTGDAETRHAVLGGGRLTVRWRRFGEEIVAIAFIEAQDRGRTHGESAA
ncbi:MAG: SDR family NAD(P)-dependent oxidoreductase [Myxococcota bacterium]